MRFVSIEDARPGMCLAYDLSEQRYVMKFIRQESGTLLPTLGITFEY